MTIKTESKIINITLKLWRGGWNAGYEPDCFGDMDNGCFARDFGRGREEGSDAILASDADTRDMIDWWQGECTAANRGEDGECLQALTEEELARGDEWTLDVDEQEVTGND